MRMALGRSHREPEIRTVIPAFLTFIACNFLAHVVCDVGRKRTICTPRAKTYVKESHDILAGATFVVACIAFDDGVNQEAS